MTETKSCDALIVGGGMAGLTAAAYLAREGHHVMLCEKESHVGGLVRSFSRHGYVFDAGIRAIENSGIVFPMLRQLGVEVEFLPSPVSIGIGPDLVRIPDLASLADYQGLLEKHFPQNRGDIAAIMGQVRKVMDYMDVLYGIDNPLFLDLKSDAQYLMRTIVPWMFKYLWTIPKIERLKMPVDEYLAGLTSNQALIDLIAQHFFQKTPTFFALGYFSLYLDYQYPRGGTGSLSAAMERFVRQHGGDIRTGTEITRVDAGRREAHDAAGNTYGYKRLIWAADMRSLYRMLDAEGLADAKTRAGISAQKKLAEDKVGGDSVFTVYLETDLDPSYFQERGSAHVFYTPSLTGLSQVRLDDLGPEDGCPSPNFTVNIGRLQEWLDRFLSLNTYEISIPALRDPALAPPGKTGLVVSCLFEYALARHFLDMGWYSEWRTWMAERIVQVLDGSLYPGLAAAVTDSFTATPLTLERVAGNSEGAITGWAFTNQPIPAVTKMMRIASSVRTPIPDTYQAGQWTFSPSGLPISILTGKLAADSVHRDLG